MTDIRATLERKLRERSAKMAVLGLGYVGLPFATVFAESGFEVIGIDPDPRKAGAVNAGESYIGDIESRQVAKLVNAKKLRATTDFSELAGVE